MPEASSLRSQVPYGSPSNGARIGSGPQGPRMDARRPASGLGSPVDGPRFGGVAEGTALAASHGGRLSFGYFSLATQRKVTRRRGDGNPAQIVFARERIRPSVGLRGLSPTYDNSQSGGGKARIGSGASTDTCGCVPHPFAPGPRSYGELRQTVPSFTSYTPPITMNSSSPLSTPGSSRL